MSADTKNPNLDPELEEFLNSLEGSIEPSATTAPSTDAPEVDDEPAIETVAPATEPPAVSTDITQTDAPATEAPDVEDVEDDEDDIPLPEDPVAAYKNLVRSLNQQPSPAQPTTTDSKEPAEPQEPRQQPAAPRPSADAKLEEVNYLEGIDFEELVESPAALNALLNKVAQGTYSRAVADAQERVLRVLPEVTTKFVAHHSALQKEAQDFYTNHPDLTHVKPYVAQVANKLAAEHPDWTVHKVFEETANTTRKVLGLQAQAVKSGARKVKAPAPQAKGPARGAKRPNLTPLEKDIQQMLNSQ